MTVLLISSQLPDSKKTVIMCWINKHVIKKVFLNHLDKRLYETF